MRSTIVLLLLVFLVLPNIQAQNRIVVSKQELYLWVISPKGDTLMTASVGVGRNWGNKTRRGDMKTPEGTFSIIQIQNASSWTHDFRDGHGQRSGAYGPWFIRLRTPINRSIGIHGTCFPESIGTRCSEGCIRMKDEDVNRLRQLIKVGDKCIVLPDKL